MGIIPEVSMYVEIRIGDAPKHKIIGLCNSDLSDMQWQTLAGEQAKETIHKVLTSLVDSLGQPKPSEYDSGFRSGYQEGAKRANEVIIAATEVIKTWE